VRWHGPLALLALGLAVTASRADDPTPAIDTPSEAAARREMVEHQLRGRDIVDPRVLTAMTTVPRHRFVPAAERAAAYGDHALPIGRGQTISQPYIVALMTQLLALRGGERVLEVGSGSGYQAAVLGQLAGEVYSIEIDPVLADQARAALAAVGARNVRVRAGDGFFGWPEAAPFDAMIITAATPRLPDTLRDQLREGGRVVAPIESADGERLGVGIRKGDAIDWTWSGAVRFVPMTGAVRATPETTH
jgi:protein-L-isoaspartate(D-aspartate) O-methyltransferase